MDHSLRPSTPSKALQEPQSSTGEKELSHNALTGSSESLHSDSVPISAAESGLQRKLSNRKVQLVAIGGSIGTALFVSIGGVLFKAGPAGLFLAFAVYNIFLAMVNNCMAEMAVYMPVTGGFIRLAGHWVDDAFGFMAGWNFFFYQCLVIPFEITALSLILSYWSDAIPVAAICAGCIFLYFCLNVFTIRIYGEAEFWLSSGKVFLIFLLFSFTFVSMVGGNPHHDAFGFRNWSNPGPFAEYRSSGNLGKFEGFLAALWAASFTCVGPEYVSMMAAEAKHPRVYVKTAYKIVYWRILVFFLGGALAVGILVPSNDSILTAIYASGSSSTSATACPYIIAMRNLGIPVLPHVATALLATTVFSAGNTYTYCATRSLYGLAVEGRAPKFLRRCTKNGIPIYCFLVVMIFPFLSFLQLSNSSATVLTWLVNLSTGATVVDNIVMCITYICFYNACKAQGFDRAKLPYTGRFQPYCGYLGAAWMVLIATCYGYSAFRPWDVVSFFIDYTMVILAPLLFLGWKLFRGTRWLRPGEVDIRWEAPLIDAIEESDPDPPIGFFRDAARALRLRKAPRRGPGGV